MEKIVLKKNNKGRKPKRSSVVVSPKTYIRVYTLAQELSIPVEQLVDTLLIEALDAVEIIDE